MKGREFEKECAAIAGNRGKRIPRSGAIGTMIGIQALAGDFRWDLPWLKKKVIGEAKHGYGGSKSITVQRDWFAKIVKQSRSLDFYPVLALKFKFAVSNGTTSCVCIPSDTMEKIIQDMENLWLEKKEVEQELQKLKNEYKKSRAKGS